MQDKQKQNKQATMEESNIPEQANLNKWHTISLYLAGLKENAIVETEMLSGCKGWGGEGWLEAVNSSVPNYACMLERIYQKP